MLIKILPIEGLNNGKNNMLFWPYSSHIHIVSSKEEHCDYSLMSICIHAEIISMYVKQIYLGLGPSCSM